MTCYVFSGAVAPVLQLCRLLLAQNRVNDAIEQFNAHLASFSVSLSARKLLLSSVLDCEFANLHFSSASSDFCVDPAIRLR